ncbi:morphogenesis protein Mor2 [Schizosaccharomyces japonicus yFS275]|uniref:Morphogenesis protein Mor2 n=1 Tax=Schizosaccharomyces japonicus (strain yFS275 / FY16936) TaxID=402676 RepID=B6K4S5_SCHJY|nr:morphogenesis protein Mor2 [Schizosaccharomyces japonicus yFS275]EEB08482.1 morphogenesis protein Mor2 [Schizosaccharomyces japonicus yFS275]
MSELLESSKGAPEVGAPSLVLEGKEKTAADYALHVLFTQFVRVSEQKIQWLSRYSRSQSGGQAIVFAYSDETVIRLLQPDADTEFDKSIHDLVVLASTKAVPVIESLLYWRKIRCEMDVNNNETPFVLERKNAVSVFILCRTLSAIIESIPLTALDEDTITGLIENIFHQLITSSEQFSGTSVFYNTNWSQFTLLVGSISRFNFAAVSDRFIMEIESLGKSDMTRAQQESHMISVLRAMHHLRLQLYPMPLLEECAAFISSMASFFSKESSMAVKLEYIIFFESILQPIVTKATVEVNLPTWSKTMESLYHIAASYVGKAKLLNITLPFLTVVLCLSPRQFFLDHWFRCVEIALARLKDKDVRSISFLCMARLFWVYFNRHPESNSVMSERVDSIFKRISVYGKRAGTILFPNVEECDTVVQFYRVFAPKFLDTLVRDALSPMLQTISSRYSLERLLVVIRTTYFILCDQKSHSDEPQYPGITRTGIKLLELWDAVDSDVWNFYVAELSQKLLNTVSQLALDANAASAILTSKLSLVLHISIMRLLACMLSRLDSKIVDLYARCLFSTYKPIQNTASDVLRYFSESLKVAKTVISILSRKLTHDSEYVLRFYHDIIRIWIAQQNDTIEHRKSLISVRTSVGCSLAKSASIKKSELEDVHAWTVIEEIQSVGVLHLSSPFVSIRRLAVALLQDVKELSTEYFTLSDLSGNSKIHQDVTVIDILQNWDSSLISVESSLPTAAERSRLRKFINDGTKDVLFRLTTSTSGVDISIWYNLFPKFIKLCYDTVPMTMALLRDTVCEKLPALTSNMISRLESSKVFNRFDTSKSDSRNTAFPESLLVQWKLYLMVACCTVTYTETQRSSCAPKRGLAGMQTSLYFRKTFDGGKIYSVEAIFDLALPLITSEFTPIREAVVSAMGCINVNAFPHLVYSLKPYIDILHNQKIGNHGLPLGGMVNKKKTKTDELLRNEVAHILSLTAYHLLDESLKDDRMTFDIIVGFVKDLKNVLSSAEVQSDWKYIKLRCYFARLLEKVILAQRDRLSFELVPLSGRVSCWRLLDEWTGFGMSAKLLQTREEHMRMNIQENFKDIRERGILLANLEVGKQSLELSTVETMMTLTAYPLDQVSDVSVLAFDINVILNWFDSVSNSPSRKIRALVKNGLSDLLYCNKEFPELYRKFIRRCFEDNRNQTTRNYYFAALMKSLMESGVSQISRHEVLPYALVNMSNTDSEIRITSLDYIETIVDESSLIHFKSLKVFLKSTDPALYLKPQYLLSVKLAHELAPESFRFASECFRYFQLGVHFQREIITVLLPWLQNLELAYDDENDVFDEKTEVILLDLLEVTIKFTVKLPNEVEALWTSIIVSPFENNWSIALKFVLRQCYICKSSTFVSHARQVFVYLAKPELAEATFKTLYNLIGSETISTHNQMVFGQSHYTYEGYYVADIGALLPNRAAQVLYSPGQLALILIMDLLPTTSFVLTTLELATLLHASITQLDHYSKEMKVYGKQLVMYMVKRLENLDTSLETAECFVGLSEQLEKITTRKKNPEELLPAVIVSTLSTFNESYPDLRQIWGKVALVWATTCPFKHIACNSVKILRAICPSYDDDMLLAVIARLHSTISDPSSEVRDYAMEILHTISDYLNKLDEQQILLYPRLFWVAIACLTTIHEEEFMAAINMVYIFLTKVDLNDPVTLSIFTSTFPPVWNNNTIVGEGFPRILACFLVLLPAMGYKFEKASKVPFNLIENCQGLKLLAQSHEDEALIKILDAFMDCKYRSVKDFMKESCSYLYNYYFESFDGDLLITLLSFLSNPTRWIRKYTLELLKELFPLIDFQKPVFDALGLDRISPLLRLLRTEFANDALALLTDSVTHAASNEDLKILRMVMSDRNSKRNINQYISIFGIPTDSGWSVSNSTFEASITKENVGAVYNSYETSEAANRATDVQFHTEDVMYQPMESGHRQRNSLETLGQDSLGEMVTTLHSLDIFFADDNCPQSAVELPTPPLEEINGGKLAEIDDGADMYDSRVAAILARSLHKNDEVSSSAGLSVFSRSSSIKSSSNTSVPSSPQHRQRKFSFMSRIKSPPPNDSYAYTDLFDSFSEDQEASSYPSSFPSSPKNANDWYRPIQENETRHSPDVNEDAACRENAYHLKTMFQEADGDGMMYIGTKHDLWPRFPHARLGTGHSARRKS